MANPRHSDASSHLQKAFKDIRKKNFAAAEAALAEALTLDEQNPVIWERLGFVWMQMGRTAEALDAFNLAVTFGTDDADVLYNVGKSLIDAGQDESGLMQMEKSFHITPSLSLAEKLGDIYYAQRNYTKSCFYYLKIYQESQSNSAILRRLAFALFQCGEIEQAFFLMVTLVNRSPDQLDYALTLSDIARGYALKTFHPDIKKAITSCLSLKNVRYFNFRTAWSSLFLLDPTYLDFRTFCTSIDLTARHYPDRSAEDFKTIFSDNFLLSGLQKIHSSSIPLENLFTNLRSFFLAHWKNYESWPKETLGFLAALSCQSWLCDYIYYETAEDKSDLAELLSFVKSQLTEDSRISDGIACLLALSSCYKPLYELVDAFGIKPELSKHAQNCLKQVLSEQLDQPLREKEIRSSLKSFTEIEDSTSQAVQAMYEERPYPRWSTATLMNTTPYIKDLSKGLEILVAGCGTGQEPALLINRMPECHITAIDLSRASLAYASRKAQELGYANVIDFYHGDLMKADRFEKEFDFVVSSGVLHHLKDPEKGLAAILKCLRPQGLLSISLYSRIARDYKLNPAIAYIKEKGYSCSVQDIRQFRRDLFSKSIGDPVLLCSETSDFYNLAECNDMLFHVQEHRYTLPEIGEMADRHGLELIQVMLTPQNQKAYHAMFPGASATDLGLLNEFELKNPNSFIEMYRVYMKRKDETLSPRLSELLELGAL